MNKNQTMYDKMRDARRSPLGVWAWCIAQQVPMDNAAYCLNLLIKSPRQIFIEACHSQQTGWYKDSTS